MRKTSLPRAMHLLVLSLATASVGLTAGCDHDSDGDPRTPAAVPAGTPGFSGPPGDPAGPMPEGVFTGTLPCETCDGAGTVDATLHLHRHGGFDLVERAEDGEEAIRHVGTWYASDDGRAILLADEDGHGGHHVFEWHGEDALRLAPDEPVDPDAPLLLVRTD